MKLLLRLDKKLCVSGVDDSNEAGRKAKAFVERELSRVPHVILTSSRADKYDRYLADVYYGECEQEKYLNQVLLDEGLATRV